jgi:hypothetical protein
MTKAERFLEFMKQRREETMQASQVLLRLDGEQLIVTCRWQASGAQTSAVQSTADQQ